MFAKTVEERPRPRPRTLTQERMPEGDTIHYAANRIRPILEGHVPDELLTPHPRFRADRWPERLAGQAVRSSTPTASTCSCASRAT